MSCHVSIIYCHGTHSCIILCTCSLKNNTFSVLHYVIKSYLALPYVKLLRDTFCLGTFARLYYAATLQPHLQQAACWQLDGPNVSLPVFFFFFERVWQMNKGHYSTVQNRSLYCLAMSWGWRWEAGVFDIKYSDLI